MKREKIEELEKKIESLSSEIEYESYALESEGENFLKSLIVPAILTGLILGFAFSPAGSFLLIVFGGTSILTIVATLLMDLCKVVDDKIFRYNYSGGGLFISIFYLFSSIVYMAEHLMSMFRNFMSKRKLKKILEKYNIHEELVEEKKQEEQDENLSIEDEVLKDLYLITGKVNDLPSDQKSIFLKRIREVFTEYRTKFEDLYTKDSKTIKLSNNCYRQIVIDTLKKIVDIEIDLDKALKASKELASFNKDAEELETLIETVEEDGCMKLVQRH